MLLVGALGVAVGCTTPLGGAPKPASPTPPSAMVNAAPTKLIVGLGEIPTGYRLEGAR